MITPLGISRPRALPIARPRFGNDFITGILNGAIQGASSPTDLKNKKGSSLKKFILFQLIPIGLLGTAISNVDRLVQTSEWAYNVKHGQPLETVLTQQQFPIPITAGITVPVTANPAPPVRTEITEERARQIMDMTRPWQAVLSPQLLNEAAQLGLVKEVQVLPLVTGKPQWKAVLIDGSERFAYEDTLLREKLVSQLNIPMRNAFTGWSQDLIPSFTAAAVLISALGVLFKRETFVRPDLTPDEKRRYNLIQAGQLLVAAHQGVSAALITKEAVDEQLLWAKQKEAFKPMDQETLEKRLRVLLAAPLIERRFCNNNPSVGGSYPLETLNELIRAMIKSLGMSSELGYYTFPSTMTDADKARLEFAVQKKIDTLTAETKTILDQYNDSAVENLVKGLDTLHPPLTQAEVKSLLTGKRVEDVARDRSFMGRLWKKFQKPQPPVTVSATSAQPPSPPKDKL